MKRSGSDVLAGRDGRTDGRGGGGSSSSSSSNSSSNSDDDPNQNNLQAAPQKLSQVKTTTSILAGV